MNIAVELVIVLICHAQSVTEVMKHENECFGHYSKGKLWF